MNRTEMKPALDYHKQIELLISRGLLIDDIDRAKDIAVILHG